MGVVWRGRDRGTGAPCAIKVLRPEFAADPASVGRFVRERTALVKFRHPNVVALRDMIVEGDCLALVMDLIDGGDLNAYRQNCGGTLSRSEMLGLTAQICDALAAAHAAGIVHRDLKPANVLLDAGQVRLADFGIARIAGEPAATTTGTAVGTVAFMAPEVFRGQEPTAACDVYAVGVTLYELLTGTQPFTGQVAAIMHGHLETAPTRPDGVPDRLWALISACLSKDPAARPPAAVLARALRDPALLREPVPAGSPHLAPYGAPPWNPGGAPPDTYAPRPDSAPALHYDPAYAPRPDSTYARHYDSTYAPRPGPATASVALPVADAMFLGAAADPRGTGAAGLPPHRGGPHAGHRGPRRPGIRPVWAAAAAAALVLAGVAATYLAMSGSSTAKATGQSSSPSAGTAAQSRAAALTRTTGHAAGHHPSPSRPTSAATPSASPGTPTAATPTPTSVAPVGIPGPTGPNLLADGDLTEPNLDAWEPVVGSTVLVSGDQGESNAVQMTGDPTAGVSQIVTGLKPGTAYQLSGWIISHTGGNTTMIGVKAYNDTDGISQRVNSTAWTEVTMTFTPSPGRTSAEVFCWQAVAGTGYCTNLSLRALS